MSWPYLITIDTAVTDTIAPKRDFLCDLDGYTYRVVLTWRERPACWYLDIYDPDGNAMLKGAGMRPGSPLLLRRSGYPWPGGALVLSPVSGDLTEALTMDGLGVTHELIYATAETVAAWLASLSPTSDLTIVH